MVGNELLYYQPFFGEAIDASSPCLAFNGARKALSGQTGKSTFVDVERKNPTHRSPSSIPIIPTETDTFIRHEAQRVVRLLSSFESTLLNRHH